jgi:SAM-dependent methyltransferase
MLPYPFPDNEFDEIHAYEVLEHTGMQGDYHFFFAQFAELWRILRPDGFLCATVPMWDSVWAWADPGHTRVISKDTLSFLCPEHYEQLTDETSASSDYREMLGKTNFQPIGIEEGEHQFGFVMQAKK